MVILVATDSFKGSLTSEKICKIISETAGRVNPTIRVVEVPLADGGEGSVTALVAGTSGRYVETIVHDPLMNHIKARYGILGDGLTAVIEMAEASGLPLVPVGKRNPLITSSYGTGELIRDAVMKGCRHIIMCIGGSATNDGGVGMLKALGFGFKDADGMDIADGGSGLLKLSTIEMDGALPELKDVSFRVACDVDNPLLGQRGAAHVYALQKGATVEDLPLLECGLDNLSRIMLEALGKDVSNIPGAGAAGGMGAGLMGFLEATLEPGFPLIASEIGFSRYFEGAGIDLVITGEGCMDRQTLNGKLPSGVVGYAASRNIPTVAIAGCLADGYEALYEKGLTAAFGIANRPLSLEESLVSAEKLYAETVENVIRLFAVGSK